MSRKFESLRSLISLSSAIGRRGNIPMEVVFAQVVLASIGVGGSRLLWKPRGSSAPRFGRPSVTFLGSREALPEWFEENLVPIIGGQEVASAVARKFVRPKSSVAEWKRRKEQAAMIGNWMPELTQMMLQKPTRPSSYHAEFVIEIGSKVGRLHSESHGFGDDRLVILRGAPAYRALDRPSRSRKAAS